MTIHRVHLGVAGWSVAARYIDELPAGGTHLERYARVFSAVEVTSPFYRHHRHATYARWAQSVGPDFRFSVKMPKALTHHGGLVHTENAVLDRFLTEVAGLGHKLRVLLVLLPPSLAFVPEGVRKFFALLRSRIDPGLAIACEPRHVSWNSQEADALLKEYGISRVAVDPARWADDALPGGDRRLVYFRMHGAPRTYFSDYSAQRLQQLAGELQRQRQENEEVWCIFDNTAHGHAIGNALAVSALLEPR